MSVSEVYKEDICVGGGGKQVGDGGDADFGGTSGEGGGGREWGLKVSIQNQLSVGAFDATEEARGEDRFAGGVVENGFSNGFVD